MLDGTSSNLNITANGCDACGRGWYGEEEGAISKVQCKQCTAGRFSSEDVLVKLNDCELCPRGQYSTELGNKRKAQCQLCGAGKYSEEAGAVSVANCTACDGGKYSDQVGVSNRADCTDCSAGMYQDRPSMAYCLPCIPSEYQDEQNQLSCKKCADHTYSTNKSRDVSCDICPRGYSATMGSVRCSRCEVGKYGNKRGKQCEDCPTGWYTNVAGQVSCTKCLEGQSFKKNTDACQACDAGTFGESPGNCTVCPSGFYQENKNSVECIECAIGKQYVSARAKCTDCISGKFGESTKCIVCPTGYYQDAEKQVKCKLCRSGLYSAELGRLECKECDPGMFSHQNGGVRCQECPVGRFVGDKGQKACSLCAKGKYSVAVKAVICIACPPLSTTQDLGAASNANCICTKDYFAQKTDDGTKTCTACPPNSRTIASGARNSSYCICQNGYWKPDANVSAPSSLSSSPAECLVCPAFSACREGTAPATIAGYWKVPWRDEILAPILANNDSTRRLSLLAPRLQCLEPTACLGGTTNETCGILYNQHSPLCASCARGAYKQAASFRCVACEKEYSNSVLFMMLVIFATLFIIVIFTWATVAAGGEASSVDVVILKIAINSGIISAGASAFPLKWPPAVVTMFQMYAVASASAIGDSLSADCVLRSGMRPVQAWGLTMVIIPPGVLFLWVALFGTMTLVSKNKQYWRVYLPVSTIVTLTFAHPVVTKAAVKLLACRTVAGKPYLDADFNISCNSVEYIVWGFLAVPLLVVFTFGVPIIYTVIMYRHVKTGTLEDHRNIYGFFFSGFRREIWWFELWNT